jgi:multiple sugar transport system permease protein
MKKIILNSILILLSLMFIYPIFWMLLLSFKQNPEAFNSFKDLLISPLSLINYSETFSSDSFGLYFINSFLIASCVTIGNILFCTTVAYAFARRKFKISKILFATVLGVLLIPGHVVMIPIYRLMVELGWLNTYFSLIIPWLVSPFGIFLVYQYIKSIPIDIEDAARVDGAGDWYILFRIVMPLCKPILTVLSIFIFLSNWNSFLFPFILTSSEQIRTLPVGLAFYLGKQSIDWGHLMAGASISATPVILLFVLFQKQIINGLTSGALKD